MSFVNNPGRDAARAAASGISGAPGLTFDRCAMASLRMFAASQDTRGAQSWMIVATSCGAETAWANTALATAPLASASTSAPPSPVTAFATYNCASSTTRSVTGCGIGTIAIVALLSTA